MRARVVLAGVLAVVGAAVVVPPAATASPATPGERSLTLQGRFLAVERRVESISGDYRESETTEQVQVDLAADVLFAFDSADLTPQAGVLVAEAAAAIAEEDPATVTVVGHTDSVGDTAYNQTLSEQRAQSVATALQAAAPGSYEVSGKGEAEPVADEADGDEAAARNRRVTITFAVDG